MEALTLQLTALAVSLINLSITLLMVLPRLDKLNPTRTEDE